MYLLIIHVLKKIFYTCFSPSVSRYDVGECFRGAGLSMSTHADSHISEMR